MVRFNSAGRVQPVEGMYLIHPGTCMLCGRIPNDPQEYFASLGVELEYYGMAYLCQACCAEIADFALFVDPQRFEEVAAVNEVLAEKVIGLQKSLAAAKEMLNARIDAAGRGEFNLHGTVSIPISETQSDSDFLNKVLDGEQPKSTKSGKGN